MTKCMICFDTVEKLLALPCGCRACHECIFNWSKSYCEENIFANQIELPCPFEHCRKPMKPEQFISLLQPQRAEQINALLLRHYMTHQKDTRTCPRPQCQYGGITGGLPKSCKDYVCGVCGTKWQDESQVGAGDHIRSWLRKGKVAKNEFLSNLVKLFMGNYCPNCSTHITKNGGCPHMVCSKCKYEFCWHCLDAYYGYRHSGTRPCGVRCLYLVFILIFLFFPFFSRLSINFPIVNIVTRPLIYMAKYVPLGLLELAGTFVLPASCAASLWELVRLRVKPSKGRICLGAGVFIILFAAYAAFNYALYVYSALLETWKLIFYAGIGLASSGITGALIGTGINEIQSNRLYRGLIFFNLFALCCSAVTMYYLDYYPKITMFCLLNVLLFLVGLDIFKDIVVHPNWRNYGISTTAKKVIFAIDLAVAVIYNCLLVYFQFFIVFKVMLLAIVLGVTLTVWYNFRRVRKIYYGGILLVEGLLYYKYIL